MNKIIKYSTCLFLVVILVACNTQEENPNELGPEYGEMTGLPAIDAITKDIKANPTDPSLYVERCEAYSREGMYMEAVKDAEYVLSQDSTNWKSYRLLAWAYFDNAESKRAIKTLEKGLEVHPNNIKLLLVHAEISHIIKQYDQGLTSAENILKKSPLHPEGLFMKGLILKDMGDTLQAIDNFQSAVEQDANHFAAYLELAHIFYQLRKDIAVDYYENALRIDSTHYIALKGLAQYYHQTGQLEEAKTAYEKMIYHHPQEADGSYNYGLLYMELGDFEKAHHFFDVAVNYQPDFGEAYFYRGLASEKMGNKQAAIRDYKNAKNNNEKFGYAEKALKRLGA